MFKSTLGRLSVLSVWSVSVLSIQDVTGTGSPIAFSVELKVSLTETSTLFIGLPVPIGLPGRRGDSDSVRSSLYTL